MSDSIFKAVVTHFESEHTTMRFGTSIYEIYPSHGSSVCFIKSRLDGEHEVLEHMMDFDTACHKIASDIEKQIAAHWVEE